MYIKETTAGKKKMEVSKEKNTRKTYSLEEASQAAKKYFKGDELAATVWVNKYALKDSYGNLFEKSPDEMHKRLASEISRVEQNIKIR